MKTSFKICSKSERDYTQFQLTHAVLKCFTCLNILEKFKSIGNSRCNQSSVQAFKHRNTVR